MKLLQRYFRWERENMNPGHMLVVAYVLAIIAAFTLGYMVANGIGPDFVGASNPAAYGLGNNMSGTPLNP
jgi:hypothetical protein